MANAATHGEAPVELVPYDPTWPARFAQERALLERLLAPWLAGSIEHIGSTAIPGMLAKPIIDVMVPVADLDAARPAIAAAEGAGYVHYPYRADVMHWFCKPSAALRTHHLHLVPHDSRLWHERLAFRDRLRAERGLAAEYSALKIALARRFRHDREAYTDSKGPFVARVLALAQARDPAPPRAPGPGPHHGGGAIADSASR
jgi:GrpB-like predicted nucleotidyltransferase (UPF0157 family)